jgi:predicted DNA-binding antitoxin AbrB/MazE fold protein
MSQLPVEIDAVYENGVFVPLGRVELHEGQQVHLALTAASRIPSDEALSSADLERDSVSLPPRSRNEFMATVEFRARGKPMAVDLKDWTPSEDD